MAGAGFKTFNTGDVLTAADVNTYLMQQTVMVFASSAARSTALGVNVAEGMLSYLKDTDVVEVYNGSAWVASDDPNAIQNSIVDAKGDLISATADNTPARLASSGVNGNVLTVDTSTATGLKWAAPAGGGKVLQVVSTTYSTATTIASTSFTDTGLSLAITPSAATSTVLVLVDLNLQSQRSAAGFNVYGQIVRGSTSIYESHIHEVNNPAYSSGNNAIGNRVPLIYLDSPNTTSSTTYKVQIQCGSTGSSQQSTAQYVSKPSSITLLEIGA